MPSESEEKVIAGIREVCSAFPKSSKAVFHVLHRQTDVGKFDRTVERVALDTVKNGYSLENKSPTAAFAPGDEKALEYVRGVAASAVQAACTMVVLIDLPANRLDVHVLKKSMCFVANAACGDPFAPEVIALSAFRDDVLMPSRLGRLFVSFYYAVSPPIAAVIARSRALRCVAMATLVQPAARIVADSRRRSVKKE